MSDKKTAIVTGASGGIGAGLVEGFLREGYNVVATSREANRKLTTSPSLVLLDGDIGKQQTAADAVEAAINNFGTVDVLVNNAGIFPRSTTATTDEATFDEVYAVNVKAPYFLTGAIAPAGQGAIINLGSWIARLGIPSALYSSTKGAARPSREPGQRNSDLPACASTRSPPASSALPIPTEPTAACTQPSR